MSTFHVKASIIPVQVDDWPKFSSGCRPGAAHFRPGATVELSEQELAHIKAKYPLLAAALIPVQGKGEQATTTLPDATALPPEPAPTAEATQGEGEEQDGTESGDGSVTVDVGAMEATVSPGADGKLGTEDDQTTIKPKGKKSKKRRSNK